MQKNEEKKGEEVDIELNSKKDPPLDTKEDKKQLKILSDDKIQFCSCSIVFYCFSPR
jgi:hypothetical protein